MNWQLLVCSGSIATNGIALRWQGIKARYIGKLDTVD